MRAAPALFLVLLAACEREPGVPPEVVAERSEAARAACISDELLRRADDNLDLLEESLETTLAMGDGAGAFAQQAARSAYEFGRIYFEQAQLRAAALAQRDSAFNRVTRPADSLRHVQRAQSLAVGPPRPGTIEANVFESYQRDFVTIAQNPDHPCNWE